MNYVYTNLAETLPTNIIHADFTVHTMPEPEQRRSTSLYKSNGIPKATAAEPIRALSDIHAIQQYFLSRGQTRNYTLFTLGILFGLRAGDLLSLRFDHIMTQDGRFKPHCDMIESKTRKFNNPAITPQIRELLTNYINECCPHYNMSDPVFRSNKTNFDNSPRPITLTQLNRILKEAAAACNVPGHISSHSLRKTFAYHMIKANPDSDEAKFAIQTMLNHSDFKTTLTYCGITQEEVDNFRAGLGAYFETGATL